MRASTYTLKPNAETENMHKLDFNFFCFGRRISANMTGNFNYTAHTQPHACI